MCPPGYRLTQIGKIIEKRLNNIKNEFTTAKIEEYIIMPNHVHFILQIIERVDTRPTPTISDIICSFKSRTTNDIIKKVKQGEINYYDSRIWQRNYYEHVIRNEKEYYKIVEYIQNNPLKWEEDKYFEM